MSLSGKIAVFTQTGCVYKLIEQSRAATRDALS